MGATLKVLRQDESLNYDVQITVMRSGINRNYWDYQNVAEYANTFAGTPILCAYVNGQIADGHNMREVHQPNGEVVYDFTGATAERIVGAISDDPADIEIVVNEEGEWVVAKGKLWRFYNQQLVDHIAKVGSMEVSAETEIFDSYQNEEIEVFTRWRGLGVTILNEKVAPAIPGANIKALQELESEFKEMKLKAASYKANEVPTEEETEKTAETEEPEETQIENKTQKSNEKGERTVKAFSKKQNAELSAKFDGYTVLSAGQDDDGIHVCLMSTNGDTAIYTMESVTDMVDAGKIRRCEAKAVFADGEWELAVDASELTDVLSATLVRTQSELEEATANLTSANNTIEEMTNKELKRRVSAAKAKALSTLAEFNANREEKIDEAILAKVNEAIDNGDYSGCENADGEWCGEEAVANEVLAACAKEVMEQDKKSAMAKNSQFVWDGLAKGKAPVNDGGISELLSKFKIQ